MAVVLEKANVIRVMGKQIEYDEEETAVNILREQSDFRSTWIIDLTDVNYIGAWILSKIIVPLHNRCADQGGCLMIINGECIKRMMEVMPAIPLKLYERDHIVGSNLEN